MCRLPRGYEVSASAAEPSTAALHRLLAVLEGHPSETPGDGLPSGFGPIAVSQMASEFLWRTLVGAVEAAVEPYFRELLEDSGRQQRRARPPERTCLPSISSTPEPEPDGHTRLLRTSV
jgi:hypothetical protein